jgi:hypothetical protein
MTRTINNRRRNQKNRHNLAALAKNAKKQRPLIGFTAGLRLRLR